jgi:hypothetical protein
LAVVTPLGTDQLQGALFVKTNVVKPEEPGDAFAGTQAGRLELKVNDAVEVPDEFVAVIVIERDARVPVGDPEISPVEVLKFKPTAVIAVESAEGIE